MLRFVCSTFVESCFCFILLCLYLSLHIFIVFVFCKAVFFFFSLYNKFYLVLSWSYSYMSARLSAVGKLRLASTQVHLALVHKSTGGGGIGGLASLYLPLSQSLTGNVVLVYYLYSIGPLSLKHSIILSGECEP